MTETCKNICVEKLNSYIRHIKYMIEDLEKDDEENEVSISSWNKYSESFDNTWPEEDDNETKKQLKEAVINVLNNRIKEITTELENL